MLWRAVGVCGQPEGVPGFRAVVLGEFALVLRRALVIVAMAVSAEVPGRNPNASMCTVRPGPVNIMMPSVTRGVRPAARSIDQFAVTG